MERKMASRSTMKALTYRRYGPPDVVTVSEVRKPTPRDHDVLVRVHASTVTTGDWRGRSLTLPPGFGLMGRLVFGILGPRQPILGTELSGVVEAVGARVTRFKPGDQVVAFTGARYGCHAQYRALPDAGMIALKPANLSLEEAAAMSFGGLTALIFLRDKGTIERGDRLLIIGASGGVGSAAVQIGKHFGAEVTGICSTRNRDLVLSLGADRVIDYAQEDFTTLDGIYDIILDTTGAAAFPKVAKVLAPNGRLVLVQASFTQTLGKGGPQKGCGQKMIACHVNAQLADMHFLASLAEAGEYKPFIDRRYAFEDGVQAHAYVDTGRKRGSVVLVMPPLA